MCTRIDRVRANRQGSFILTLVTLLLFLLAASAFGADSGWDTLRRPQASSINIDDAQVSQANEANPLPATSPIEVVWRSGGTKVVQVYRQGNLIFPPTDPHEEHGSGLRISLSPGLHEIKVWVPETMHAKSTWVNITG
jgi:hypothetical protein